MDYKPGDVANGHMLGADGQWHPVGSFIPPPPPVNVMPVHVVRDGYWARWLRRWKWTWLAVSAVFVAVTLSGGAERIDSPFGAGSLVAGLLMSFFCGGLFVGTLVNFLVAAFPSRR